MTKMSSLAENLINITLAVATLVAINALAIPITQDIPLNIYCMSKVEQFNCHPSGTDWSLVKTPQDSRCKSSAGGTPNSAGKRINATSQLSKPCPCKANHSGLKCETCSDGFHLKYHQYSATNLTTILPPHISPNYTKQFRLFSCKPCNCYTFGSKSHICDKRNGTCFCVDGHTGPKCDKCALGYFNATSSTKDPPSIHNQRLCKECGACFNQWYIAIMDIKEMSIDMIKKTHELSQSLTSSMSVQTFNSETGDIGEELITIITSDNNGGASGHIDAVKANHSNDQHDSVQNKPGAKLVLNGNHDSFNELDEKISTIGERVLANKHNSDKLKLLADELDSTINYYNETRQQLVAQKHEFSQLSSRIKNLNYVISLESFEIDELRKLVSERYRRGQLAIQEFIPRGSHRLLQDYGLRSKHLVDMSIQEKSRYFNESSNSRIQFEMQLDKLRSSRKELDGIGVDHMRYYIENTTTMLSNLTKIDPFLQAISSYLWPNVIEQPNNHNKGYFDNMNENRDLTGLLIQETNNSVTTYLNDSEIRKRGLELISQNLIVSSEVLNQTESLIEKLQSNITTILYNINSLNDSNSCDVSKVLTEHIQTTRTALDKVDAKWSVTQSEISDLLHINSTSGVTEHLMHLSSEINKTLETFATRLDDASMVKGDQLEEIDKLGLQVQYQVIETSVLNAKLEKLINIRQEVASVEDNTRQMSKKTLDETNNLQFFFQAIKFNNSFAEKQTDSRFDEKLTYVQNRLHNLSQETIVSKLSHRKVLTRKVGDLSGANRLNTGLLLKLNNTFSDLSSCISAMGDTSPTAKSTEGLILDSSISNTTGSFSSPVDETNEKKQYIGEKTKFLREQRRVANLISGYRLITRQLFKRLGQTEDMREDFAYNREVFTRQMQLISNLTIEIDDLNLDIKKKLEYYESDECN